MKAPLLFATLITMPSLTADTSLTIYNQGIGVVRETINLDLKEGVTSVSFDQATAQVRPDSVVLRDPAGNANFSILEQSYRNDPVSQGLLLQYFEGETIEFQTQVDNKPETVTGKIIRSGYVPGGRGNTSPIIEVGGKLQFSLPGQPIFPALGDDSILRPTLSWQIGSGAAAQFPAQLSYISNGFNWSATYNVVAPEKGETVTINGWTTITNNSGTGFDNSKIKLVAGEVEVNSSVDYMVQEAGARLKAPEAFHTAAAVEQKAFDDFHLYTLPRPLTIRDRETKQVEFLGSNKVQANKRYIYAPFSYHYYGSWNFNSQRGSEFSREVETYWEFKNSEENGLGVPFPAGNMRFYRSDEADGNIEFVGENKIDHTTKNELISVQTGEAFDLLGDRTVKNFQTDSKRFAKETIEIVLTNRSEEPKTITAREPLWRFTNWKIEDASHEFEKVNAQLIEFTEEVPADSKVTITYTAHYFDR